MPYKRYSRKKSFRRKTIRKRRYSKKRYSKRKSTTYDGIYYAKIHRVADLTWDSVTSRGYYNVHWGNSGTSDARDCHLNDTYEYNNLYKVFALWRLKGIKIKIDTASEVTGGGRAYFTIYMASYPDRTIDSPESALTPMMQQADFKQWNS